MEHVSIEFATENSAFYGEDGLDAGPECARILKHLARLFEDGSFQDGDYLAVRDVNGNTVGRVQVT